VTFKNQRNPSIIVKRQVKEPVAATTPAETVDTATLALAFVPLDAEYIAINIGGPTSMFVPCVWNPTTAGPKAVN
jgi:hypothetical protein